MSPQASTFSQQQTLPRLPIPSLEETCTLYLKSIMPLQTPEEHARTKSIVEEFCSNPLSRSLQQRLIDLDRASPNNWLEDNFWLRKEWREPLMVNSNWYILGQKDINHPKQLIANRGIQPSRLFSHFQIKRAAHMIRRGLEYKEFIDTETLPIERLKVTRIPLLHCDALVQANTKDVHHIIVLVRDQVYQLHVYKEIQAGFWILLSTEEIESALLSLIRDLEEMKDPSSPIPLLTSLHRDKWAMARNHLLTINHQTHRDNLKIIEDALFAVALDDHSNGIDYSSWTKTAFCGHQGLGHGHNRWFDKSLTLVVENNGMCAISGEHSPVDAMIVSWAFDYMLKDPVPGEHTHQFVHPSHRSNRSGQFRPLKFDTDITLDKFIDEANTDARKVATFSDSNVLLFDDYGTDWIKKIGRVPPDAFYQMVLQLAYYRAHHRVTATYETAATRKYLRGRTETIRTLSVETREFVEGFDRSDLSKKGKYDLLVKAAAAHRLYTQLASDGRGCDRHLLALRLLNADHTEFNQQGELVSVPLHSIFTDPIHDESQHWRLSTSSLHAGIRLMGTGFGTVYHDGYGINYMAAPDLVKFGIECKHVPETLSSNEFIDVIRQVLKDLQQLCQEVQNQSKL
ncbi:Carnitine O-acetyltransferase [Choanephora cucurbitarum]|uniref:Carnitine O-acetyltransferase n=1 Tax=Choanephora cucurbitarum TaxID=101091 RepID=A0A1C7N1I8_9FUNG|nr:Carnitine O-acetyltransferase [Choanephora cucurbitarum]